MGSKDFVQIIRVLSSAGGGKTTELSKRFISLLKENPDSLSNILAITFTNKAADEMKERIINNLKKEALNGDEKSGILVDTIINNFTDFSVKTISSFTYSLIRAFQFELGINYETEVELNKDAHLQVAFEKLLEKGIENKRLMELLKSYAEYYSRKGLSILYWKSIFQELVKMVEEISTKRIKLAKVEKVDINDPLYFSYCFYNLVQEFRNCISDVEKEENIILIDRFGDYINKIYESTDSSVPYIYYKIGNRFKHILIDEFQDTSVVDWENIFPIVENVLSEGGTFFYVGDTKKSIYKWRGGDPSLFDKVKKDFGRFKSIDERLDKNYRSSENIIKFVIELFRMEEIKNIVEEIDLPLEYFNDIEQDVPDDSKGKGYVVIKNKKEDEINEAIIEELREILGRWDYSDVAILTRKNKQANEIAKILSENGIPYFTNEDLNIFENFIVREMISFLKFANTPYDDVSFFNFITGECFQKVSGIKKEDIINECLNFKKAFNYLYICFKEKFKKEWEDYIKPLFNMTGYVPVYDLIIEFVSRYQLYKHFKEEIAFIEGFLEYVYNIEDRKNSISMILDEIERGEFKLKQGISKNAVFISTIHNVKGLGFPVVFIPYLKYKPHPDAIPKRLFIGDKEKIYAYLDKEVFEEEHQKIVRARFSEEINLLYVALTRAKNELIVYYTKDNKENVKDTYRGLGELWNTIFTIYLRKIGKEKIIMGEPFFKKEKSFEVKYIYPDRKSSYNKLIKSVVFKKDIIEKEEEKIGEAFHKAISMCDEINEEIFLKNIELVVDSSFPKYKREIAKSKLEELGRCLLNWDAAMRLLNEKEFKIEKWGYDDEGLIRMDRIIMKKDEVIVLDFKTGEERKEDKKQVLRYKKFLQEIYRDKKIKGILLYVKERKMVEV